MESITIKNSLETPKGWQFTVILGEEPNTTQHKVTVSREYWQKLTDGKMSVEELIVKSFEFLLEREDKESILRTFKLPMIGTFYPEYEIEVGKHKSK